MALEPTLSSSGQNALNVTAGGFAFVPADFTALISNISGFSASFVSEVSSNALRSSYRQLNAQGIRDGSGTDGNEGNTATTPGLSNAGALVVDGAITISSEANAITEADSGTGTEGDPYIIENRQIVAPGATQCFFWSHAAADYYIELRNCELADGNAWELRYNTGTKLTLRHCKIYDTTANAYVVRDDAGDVEYINCLFAGDDCTRTFGLIGDGDKTFTNCKYDESEQTTSDRLFQTVSANTGNLTITNCDFQVASGASATNMLDIPANGLGTITMTDSIFAGWDTIIDQAGTGTDVVDGMAVTNCRFEDCDLEIIMVNWVDNSTFTSCTFDSDGNGAGSRLIQLDIDTTRSGTNCDNVIFDKCKFTKDTGTGSGDECFFCDGGKDVVVKNSWVTEATDEAYEFTYAIGGCRVENCVGDNVAGQIVDFFGTFDESGWAQITSSNDLSALPDQESYVYGIYGDCISNVVLFSGVRGIVAHDIYGDNSAGSAEPIRLADDGNSVQTRNIFIAGPAPLDAESGDTPQVQFSGTNNNCEANWIDETGTLQTVT